MKSKLIRLQEIFKTLCPKFLILATKEAVAEETLMPAKDPMDWTLTKNSSEWTTDRYCPRCKNSTTHRERMADICNNCGFFGNMTKYRSYRKIWNGEKWVWQYKYRNGPKDYEIVEINEKL
jgi:hypothetical protein